MPRLNSDLDRALSVFNGPDRSEITLSELVVWDKIAWLLKRHRELHRRAQAAESRVATLQKLFMVRKNEEEYWKRQWEYEKTTTEYWVDRWREVATRRGLLRTLISKVW